MNRLTIVLFVLFSLSTLFAQANPDYDGVKPEVYQGSRALVFTYTPFQSNLGSVPAGSFQKLEGGNYDEIQIGGIGIKYFVSDQISLLGSLGFGSESITTENGTNSKTETSTTYFGLSIDADYHLPDLYNISTYFGANINIGSLSREETYPNNNVEYSSSSFGIGLNIGFDWFFTEGISLGGKYALGFKSLTEPEIRESSGNSSNTTTGPSESLFGTGVGTIVLSVHF